MQHKETAVIPCDCLWQIVTAAAVPGSSSITPPMQYWDLASCPKLSDMDVASCGERGSGSITPVIQHWDHASCPKLSDMDVASCGEGGATLGYCSITTSYAVRMNQELCRCSALAELGLSPTTSVKSVHQFSLICHLISFVVTIW